MSSVEVIQAWSNIQNVKIGLSFPVGLAMTAYFISNVFVEVSELDSDDDEDEREETKVKSVIDPEQVENNKIKSVSSILKQSDLIFFQLPDTLPLNQACFVLFQAVRMWPHFMILKENISNTYQSLMYYNSIQFREC